MHVVGIWTILRFADPILIGTALFCLLRQKLAGRYPSFTAFLIFRLVSVPVLYVLLAQPPARYKFYFVAYWIGAAIEAGLTLWCVGQMFSIALSPLRGIRKLAASTFGCMCAISLIVAAAMSISSSLNGPRFLIELV